MEEAFQSENERESVSASPDFAQVYIFIHTFGTPLKLPSITLGSLEDFFVGGYQTEDNKVALIHWRLLNATYRVSRVEWMRSAVKCARRHGLCKEGVTYSELPAIVKLKLFRLCCEDQFDYNVSFKNDLKRETMEGPLCQPLLGIDSTGQKHWLLKDSVHDIRLYGESHYDVEPPKRGQWVELARSLDGLAEYIAKLESTRVRGSNGSHDLPMTSLGKAGSEEKTRERSRAPKSGAKKSMQGKKSSPVWDGDESIEGCMKCRKDTNHSQMLLCDECDRECHTHCQYPRLWKVPRGKWICPICKESQLIETLKIIYNSTAAAKENYDKSVERKQRSIARLQKTGLLLQNIILDEGEEEASRRSRRSRKEINYAELNDLQLPPLGKWDYVGSDWSQHPQVNTRKRTRQEYVHDDYLAPRIRNTSRRFRGSPVAKETTSEPLDEDEPVADAEVVSTASSSSGQLCGSIEPEESLPPSDQSEFQSNGEHPVIAADNEFESNKLVPDSNTPSINSESPNTASQQLPLSTDLNCASTQSVGTVSIDQAHAMSVPLPKLPETNSLYKHISFAHLEQLSEEPLLVYERMDTGGER